MGNDGVYDNFKRRQRAYLRDDGKWAIFDASEEKDFYCVAERDVPTCDAHFNEVWAQSDRNQWSVKHTADSGYSAMKELEQLERDRNCDMYAQILVEVMHSFAFV